MGVRHVKQHSVKWVAWVAALSFVLLQSFPARADTSQSYTPGVDVSKYTLQTYIDWLNKYKNAVPQFKPGDVLTWKDKEKLRPFVPPGSLEQLNFPEFKAEIVEPGEIGVDRPYLECTEKYQSQVKLKPNGMIENYVCGQPFPNSEIKEGDPNAGIKAAWNFEYRWQRYGVAILSAVGIITQPGKSHQSSLSDAAPILPPNTWGITYDTFHITTKWPTGVERYLQGGGSWPRILQAAHQRVYFNHVALLPDHNYTLPVSGADGIEYKEFTGFFAPYDIRGTTFIIYWPDQATNPDAPSQGWSYIPEIRRVRRVSAEVRSDSLLGTDDTLDDFYGFSGHMKDWTFKFLGYKKVLGPFARQDFPRLYGPQGMIPRSKWELRTAAVVYRKSKDPHYPESGLMFWSPEIWGTGYFLIFDHNNKLWKIHFYWAQTRDSVKAFREMTPSTKLPQGLSQSIINVQQNRGTMELYYGVGYPDVDLRHVRDLYDVNKLEQMHR